MSTFAVFRLSLLALLVSGALACHDSETTTAPGAIANLQIDAPDSVRSGQAFTVDVSAVNVGLNNIHNGQVQVTLAAPLQVNSVEASAGTSAVFSTGPGGAVSWTLNTLDSNSQSRLHVNVVGNLPPGSAAQRLTVRAAMTADGIRPGDAVAEHTVELMP
jgi:hypothetical protein